MQMRKAINPEAVSRQDPFVISVNRKDGWRVIESQPDIHAAMRTRDKLAAHSLKVGDVENDDDIRIFRSKDVSYY